MARLDRLATLYLFNRVRNGRSLSQQIPILMYHSISQVNRHTGHPYYETRTSPEAFMTQMRLLHEHSYLSITLEDALLRLRRRQPSSHQFVITFDDGYRDFYTHAFPVLRQYGFGATVYLPTAYISNHRCQFNGLDNLTWHEVRELQAAGVRFGSHTVSHPQLRFLSLDNIWSELHDSKAAIEDKLGAQIDSFSYPFAFPETDRGFTARLRDMLKRCYYQTGVSTIVGTIRADDDEFFLKRVPVNDWDDPALLQAKLEGGYDWFHGLQRARKLLSTRRHVSIE